MDWVLLGLRLSLAATFVIAAASKVVAHARFVEAVRAFGVPAPLARPAAIVVPAAELILAALLVATAYASWGALGAMALLGVFTAAVAVNLLLGRRPDCGCFGETSSAPIGTGTLVRNGTMIAAAAAIWLGERVVVPAAAPVALRSAVLIVVVVAIAIAIARRRSAAASTEVAASPATGEGKRPAPAPSYRPRVMPPGGLPPGTPAPSFALDALDGGTESLEALRAPGRPVLLAFVDPRCVRCAELLPDLAAWQRDRVASFTLALITRYAVEENREKFAPHGVAHVLLQRDREVMDAYAVDATPSMVLIDANGTVAEPLVRWAEHMHALVERIAPLDVDVATRG